MKMSSGAENADVKYSNLLSAEANKLNRFASSQLNSSYTQLDIADTANRNSRKRVTESEVQAAAIHEISEVCTKLLTISDEYRTLLINAFGVTSADIVKLDVSTIVNEMIAATDKRNAVAANVVASKKDAKKKETTAEPVESWKIPGWYMTCCNQCGIDAQEDDNETMLQLEASSQMDNLISNASATAHYD